MAKKKPTTKPRQKKAPKPQINVRMEQELYDLVAQDANEAERKLPAQVRFILKNHYEERLQARKDSPE